MKFKTLKCLLVGAVLVCALALIPVGAANNPVTFTSGRLGTNLWTGGVIKTTSSSVYMYCSSITDYGVSSAAQYDAYVKGATLQNGSYQDCSHGYVYNFKQGTTRYMYNWVWEDLKTDNNTVYAGVQAIAPSGSIPLNAAASWRPDC